MLHLIYKSKLNHRRVCAFVMEDIRLGLSIHMEAGKTHFPQ